MFTCRLCIKTSSKLTFSILNMFYKVLTNFCILTVATDAMIGFVRPDGDPSDTWLELKTTGSLTLSAGGLTTSDSETLTINNVYFPNDTEWIHVAVACNRLSARCYLFRNGSFVGESAESVMRDWFVSTDLFIG